MSDEFYAEEVLEAYDRTFVKIPVRNQKVNSKKIRLENSPGMFYGRRNLSFQLK